MIPLVATQMGQDQAPLALQSTTTIVQLHPRGSQCNRHIATCKIRPPLKDLVKLLSSSNDKSIQNTVEVELDNWLKNAFNFLKVDVYDRKISAPAQMSHYHIPVDSDGSRIPSRSRSTYMQQLYGRRAR